MTNNPEWTKDDFTEAKPFTEMLPNLAASDRRARGPQKSPVKKRVSLRLDGDVIEHFKGAGPGWQTRINETLRKAIRRKRSA